MKFGWVFLTACLPVIAAFSSPQDVRTDLGTDTLEASGESVSATLERRDAPGAQAASFTDTETRGEASRDFAYNWPAQVSAIGPLVAEFVDRRTTALAGQKLEWEEALAEFAGMDCVTCINRSYAENWEVVADTPRFLVLRDNVFIYSGGAHGNVYFETLIWDREAVDGMGDDRGAGTGEALRPVDLFVNEVALENTAYGEYCQSLLVLRGERMETNIEGLNPFENCPSVSELDVVFTASNGEHFDQITFLAAPYVAGSYAEGPYEFSIPMTAALLDIVRPEYRSAFALGE